MKNVYLLVRGYAEDSDDNYCEDRYEGISNESEDGKDAFNAGNVFKKSHSKGRMLFSKGRIVAVIMKSYISKEKVKDIMSLKKMIWIAVSNLSL